MSHTRRGTDIKLLGGLFMLVGLGDVIIIVMFPEYSLKLFGASMSGPASLPIKLHAPLVHLVIGYGFLFLKPWAWALAVVYSGFGLVSEGMNQWTFGLSVARCLFMTTTAAFALYLLRRQRLFLEEPASGNKAEPVSQESR